MNYLRFIRKISLFLLSAIFICHNSFADYQIKGDDIRLDTSSFSGILSSEDTTPQKAFETIDKLSLPNSAEWGNITGTITNQTDLINYLSTYYQPIGLVSGTTIKTINSASLFGSGDISLQTPLTADVDYLTPGTAASTYQPIGSYLTSESDPNAWLKASDQTGLTGDKTGTFDINTSGKITLFTGLESADSSTWGDSPFNFFRTSGIPNPYGIGGNFYSNWTYNFGADDLPFGIISRLVNSGTNSATGTNHGGAGLFWYEDTATANTVHMGFALEGREDVRGINTSYIVGNFLGNWKGSDTTYNGIMYGLSSQINITQTDSITPLAQGGAVAYYAPKVVGGAWAYSFLGVDPIANSQSGIGDTLTNGVLLTNATTGSVQISPAVTFLGNAYNSGDYPIQWYLSPSNISGIGTDFSFRCKIPSIASDVTLWYALHDGSFLFPQGIAINSNGGDSDTYIEGDTDANLFYADAGNDRVGIGTSSPGGKFEISGTDNETYPVLRMRDADYSAFWDIHVGWWQSNDDLIFAPNGSYAALGISTNNGVAIGSYVTNYLPPENGLIVSGNVGLGSTSPYGYLVVGNGGVESGNTATYGITINPSDNNEAQLVMLSTSGMGSAIYMGGDNTAQGRLSYNNAIGSAWEFWYDWSSGYYRSFAIGPDKVTTGSQILGSLIPNTTPSASVDTGGSIPNGTYHYVVTAVDYNDEEQSGTTTELDSNEVTTTTGNNKVNITWTAREGAKSYKIYRLTSAQSVWDEPSDVYLGTSTTNSYTDTAASTSAGTYPAYTHSGLSNGINNNGTSWLGTGGLILPNGTVQAGTSTNNITIGSTGITYTGTARPKRSIYIPVGSMWVTTTSGATAPAKTETSTNKVNYWSAAFSGTSEQIMQFDYPMPKDWDGGTITAIIYYIPTGTTGGTGISWKVSGVCIRDNETMDQAFGTAVTIKDTIQTANYMHITAESGAITVAGTLSGEKYIHWKISRPTSTNTNAANLVGVMLKYTSTKESDE